MSYWQGPSRWINTILLIIVGFVAFDTLFKLLEANESNAIVGFVALFAGLFLAPFQGMFDEQDFLLTALIALLGYAVLAGIALAIVRSIEGSKIDKERAATRKADAGPPRRGTPPTTRETPSGEETTQRL